MLIRRQERSDVDAILHLFDVVAAENRFIGTEPGYDREKKRRGIESRLGSDDTPSFAAVDDERLVGILSIGRHPDIGDTLGMLILASHRRRGIGRALMYAADVWAMDRGVRELNLFVFPHNEAALGLYRACGYVEIERFPNDVTRADGQVWDTIHMRKTFA